MARQKLSTHWIEADFIKMTSKQMKAFIKKYDKNVKKPTAFREKKWGGRTFTQIYHKPFRPQKT
jgi:hypothetical protein